MVDASAWCGLAVTSLFSLWRNGENFARRNSKDGKNVYRPTATFHAIVALGECGVWAPEAKIKKGSLVTPFYEAPHVTSLPSPREVLSALVTPPRVGSRRT